MRGSFAVSVVLTLVAIETAHAQFPVFGMELDKPFPPVKRVCKMGEYGSKDLCWVGSPLIHKDGTKSGTVHLPDDSARPSWATHGLFRITLGKRSEFRSMQVMLGVGENKLEMFKSLELKFGKPVFSTVLLDEPGMAEWEFQGGLARLFCHKGKCNVDFYSATTYAEIQQSKRERLARDATKPKTP